MNQLKMKAKAGVTLVELLVVILIVTILSVSMLPLLQPFVTEAQYAAEAIPVIGNLRTKIGLYQYEKGYLPNDWNNNTEMDQVQTWKADESDSEKYVVASYTLTANTTERTTPTTPDVSKWTEDTQKASHIGLQTDIDYQDLKGKRSKPVHYQYYVISATNNPSYAIACFGDGNGLKVGTGYAVCEINFTKAGKKYIGTWKRYKATNEDAGALNFNSANEVDEKSGKPIDCYIPSASDFAQTSVSDADSGTGEPSLISNMRAQGWEF
ncbi:MAG: type II secretion system protein [bacterium]|nr:type II secretion system protein [bacterium]